MSAPSALPTQRVRIPFLRLPCFVDGDEVRYGNGARQEVSSSEAAMVRAVFAGGVTLEELVEIGGLDAGRDTMEATEDLARVFSDPRNAIGVLELEAPLDPEIIVVEQGYGGVYVHTVELFKELRKRWRCLLLSPVEPLFEPEPLPDVLTLERLCRARPELDYFTWVQVVRTLVKRSRCRLLLVTHRSQSLFLFDVLQRHRTVIYCDGYFDGAFRRVHDFRLDETEESRRAVLEELYYVIANGPPHFYGVLAAPSINVRMLMAGAYSLDAAVENWCWGKEQHEHFTSAFPGIAASIKLMLPFTNPNLFRPAEAKEREPRVLFTTTMHNIHEKGLPELVEAMTKATEIRTRVVVRQPERLPKIPARVLARMEIGGVSKDAMTTLYHRMWVNCRTSRSESSPMSILESMTCELPQIVSPIVARQIPILEDGATGFIVDPDDSDGLVWALQRILGDRALRDRMGRECRRRANQLSFEARSGEFERLLA
ncbi:MAG: glycosyltransferase family 4 protein [Planctomycetes bacterium]|nr:glycosyltransferase family 4 protein [Planctomycetota bacterium]